MGVWEKIKGWLNIGGVKVRLEGVEPKVPSTSSEIAGRVVLTSKGDKYVYKLVCQFAVDRIRTNNKDNKRETQRTLLGETCVAENFEIKTGQTQTFDFRLPHTLTQSLAEQSGVLGFLGSIGTAHVEYFVVAQCDVKDTVLDPGDQVRVTIG